MQWLERRCEVLPGSCPRCSAAMVTGAIACGNTNTAHPSWRGEKAEELDQKTGAQASKQDLWGSFACEDP